MALARLSAAYAKKTGVRVLALTVDHGLRQESAEEAVQTAKWCKAAGLKHRLLRWEGAKPASGVQDAARRARYGMLVRAAEDVGFDALLTAHSADDQAETVFMRLARGAGAQGLAAMAEKTKVAAGVGAGLRVDASLRGLLDAIVAGFEFGGRMGGLFRARPGIHVDGTWGSVAAAVTARRLYGGDGADLAAATTAALCQMPASLYLPVAQGADLRNSYSGHAASAGLLIAASLATGMTTPMSTPSAPSHGTPQRRKTGPTSAQTRA